ncbi:MAG: hypothetical protein M0R40_08985 [Firmicutes bacterium]|nr:hypothetical protein [Bacillota bacterium]
MKILRLTKHLYGLAANLNLYVHYCKENKPNMIRVKNELHVIRKLIEEIEKELNYWTYIGFYDIV